MMAGTGKVKHFTNDNKKQAYKANHSFAHPKNNTSEYHEAFLLVITTNAGAGLLFSNFRATVVCCEILISPVHSDAFSTILVSLE